MVSYKEFHAATVTAEAENREWGKLVWNERPTVRAGFRKVLNFAKF